MGNNTKPRRVQRSRERGWRMPENTVYVGRPTKMGNPFTVQPVITPWDDLKWAVFDPDGNQRGPSYYQKIEANRRAVSLFEGMIKSELVDNPSALDGLRGKNLACWCRLGEPCHAEVLLELANKDEKQRD